MKTYNKTESYQSLSCSDLLSTCSYIISAYFAESDIKTLTFFDDTVEVETVSGSRVILPTNVSPSVNAIVRWYDALTGEGMVRLPSGRSVVVYACNMVGANSRYPQLVTNVNLEAGETLKGLLHENLGLTYFSKAV